MTAMTAHDYAIRRAAKAADRAETELTNARRDAARNSQDLWIGVSRYLLITRVLAG